MTELTEKTVEKLSEKFASDAMELRSHIATLVGNIKSLIEDASPIVIKGLNIGFVCELNIANAPELVCALGVKDGVVNALGDLTKTVNEDVVKGEENG